MLFKIYLISLQWSILTNEEIVISLAVKADNTLKRPYKNCCKSQGTSTYRTTYNKPCARRGTWLQGKNSKTIEIVTDDMYTNGTNKF